MQNVRIHPTADVSSEAQIGDGVSIWNHAQVREGAHIGRNCIISKGAYIDFGVHIGDNVKVQNYAVVYHGVTIEDGVFVGPHVCFTNDRFPRAINLDGSLQKAVDWELSETRVCKGASIGANATVICGVVIGRWALVGAGSVVTRDVPDYGLVLGNPARLQGFVCPCGERLQKVDINSHNSENDGIIVMACSKCRREIEIPLLAYRQLGEVL